MDDATLMKMAEAMRGIFERTSAGYALDQTHMFGGFPRGTCGPVSELVARYLHEFYGLDAGYVSATREADAWSHAWVDVGGLTIDLTADQFGDAAPIIVARSSAWHTQWDAEPPRPPVLPPGWPSYPHVMWYSLVTGMEAAGFAGSPTPMEGNASAAT